MLSYLPRAISLIGLAALASALAAAVATVLKKWPTARLLARWGTLVAVAALALLITVFKIATMASGYFVPSDVDPTQRARYLAQEISETINCAAFSLLALLIAAPF